MTISEALQQAIDALTIKDVYVKSLTARYEGDFNPKFCENKHNLTAQGRHNVTGYHKLDFNDKSLLLVHFDLGSRLVRENPSATHNSEPEVCAIIEAEFIAEYVISNPLSEQSINEFVLKNASYHVWPYWRELVSSQTTRMQLPKIILPLQQFAKNSDLALKELEDSTD